MKQSSDEYEALKAFLRIETGNDSDCDTSYDAMISGTPSAIWVQAMEEAVVIEIPYAL